MKIAILLSFPFLLLFSMEAQSEELFFEFSDADVRAGTGYQILENPLRLGNPLKNTGGDPVGKFLLPDFPESCFREGITMLDTVDAVTWGRAELERALMVNVILGASQTSLECGDGRTMFGPTSEVRFKDADTWSVIAKPNPDVINLHIYKSMLALNRAREAGFSVDFDNNITKVTWNVYGDNYETVHITYFKEDGLLVVVDNKKEGTQKFFGEMFELEKLSYAFAASRVEGVTEFSTTIQYARPATGLYSFDLIDGLFSFVAKVFGIQNDAQIDENDRVQGVLGNTIEGLRKN